jgi:glyoxylase-like metal-dependent hydrolase (beta-lactamase superfamily II)
MVFTSHYSGSKGNLYSVRGFAEEILLIDPGVSLKRIVKAMHYSLGEVIGALVSHSHADHCQGVVDLISEVSTATPQQRRGRPSLVMNIITERITSNRHDSIFHRKFLWGGLSDCT